MDKKPLKKTRQRVKPISKTIKIKSQSWDYEDKLEFNKELIADNLRSVPDLVAYLENNKNVEIDAIVYHYNKNNKKAYPKKLDKSGFIEAYKKNNRLTSFKESIDGFALDLTPNPGLIGTDFVPLLGGPFNKQLYLYDMLKMMSQSFYAMNHDPIIKTAIDIICHFTLGRGFRVDCKDKKGLAIWRAFEEVNNLQQMMYMFLREVSAYGEHFVWWLPNNETKIGYQLPKEQSVPIGLIPRVRLIDPSTVWEIVTFPEDITRQLYLQQVFPTQYQIYTGSSNGRPVPSTKFIYQQIPAGQYKHYKINAASNEKRGRSEIFPVLGYAKRLRDSVNYSIIGMQKTTSWAIDTTVDGNQQDIDAYIQSQQDIGTIPPPGSEFVHSTKVKREYLSNEGSSKSGASQAFDWCLTMIAAGLGIPETYFSSRINGGSNRATALVATEPVAKKFEMRQQLIENVLQDMSKELFSRFNIDAEIEVTFPEIVVQDRDAKLKAISMAEANGWISHSRAAEMAAKELGITKYDWEIEQEAIKKDMKKMGGLMTSDQSNPLTTPSIDEENKAEPVLKDDISAKTRKDISDNNGF